MAIVLIKENIFLLEARKLFSHLAVSYIIFPFSIGEKFIVAVAYLQRQASNKHLFESPDIIQVVFRASSGSISRIIGDALHYCQC